jgi:secreted PhoX family phosphatase
MDPETGMWRDLAHMGHLQHENLLPLRLKKWVFVTTDDDFRAGQPAYFYAYISNSFNGALRGTDGGLHVFVPDPGEETGNAQVTTKTQVVNGHWVPITQAENANDVTLKAAATAKGAFRFDRMEDVTALPGNDSRIFIADTGKAPATLRGRVYQFDFNRNDPTRATMRMILNGDGAPPNGGDDIFNPDNMAASERVLMIQEDRESAFRAGTPANSGGYGRVMEYRFSDGQLRSVARVNTPPGSPPNPENCAGCLPGTWESSGIIDAGDVIGKDWWLLDVQAHNSTAPQPGPTLAPNSSTGENGQLLAVKVPGSQGDDDRDEDDDDD